MFLPKLCASVLNAPETQVALFGHVDTRNNPAGELKGMRWGVLNTLTGEEQTFEVRDPGAELFIRNAPLHNRPMTIPVVDDQEIPVLDQNGAQISRQVPDHTDHFAFSYYANRFSISFDLDTSQRIQSIAIHCVSLMDRSVRLTENNWAVTVVSAKQCSRNFFTQMFSPAIGHAMVACEGVQQGKPFLKYIHATSSPRLEPNEDQLTSYEGLIVDFDMRTPLDTVNGPTWIRSKALVQHMFSYVESLRGVPVKFALLSHFSSGEEAFLADLFRYLKDACRAPEASNLSANIVKLYNEVNKYFEDDRGVPLSCLGWARRIVYECGIILGKQSKSNPLEEIKRINSSPASLMPDHFDPVSLGETFSDANNAAMKAQMLSTDLFLAPIHCTPEECKKWRSQWSIARIQEKGDGSIKNGVWHLLKHLEAAIEVAHARAIAHINFLTTFFIDNEAKSRRYQISPTG